MEFIDKYLQDQKNKNCYRFLRPIEARGNGKIIYKGVEYWDFSSNDYLGTQVHHPKIVEASTNLLLQ